LQQHHGEVVDVPSLQLAAFLALRSLTDAIAPELHNLAHGKHVGGFDMFMDKAMRVESLKNCDQTGGKLTGFLHGQALPTQHLAKVGIDRLHHGVYQRSPIQHYLAKFFQLQNIWVVQRCYSTPAGQYFIFVEMRLDQPYDPRNPTAIRG
jgi:hypothetical protein